MPRFNFFRRTQVEVAQPATFLSIWGRYSCFKTDTSCQESNKMPGRTFNTVCRREPVGGSLPGPLSAQQHPPTHSSFSTRWPSSLEPLAALPLASSPYSSCFPSIHPAFPSLRWPRQWDPDCSQLQDPSSHLSLFRAKPKGSGVNPTTWHASVPAKGCQCPPALLRSSFTASALCFVVRLSPPLYFAIIYVTLDFFIFFALLHLFFPLVWQCFSITDNMCASVHCVKYKYRIEAGDLS